MPSSVVVPLAIMVLKQWALSDHSSVLLRVLVTGWRCGHWFLRDAPTSASAVCLFKKKWKTYIMVMTQFYLFSIFWFSTTALVEGKVCMNPEIPVAQFHLKLLVGILKVCLSEDHYKLMVHTWSGCLSCGCCARLAKGYVLVDGKKLARSFSSAFDIGCNIMTKDYFKAALN